MRKKVGEKQENKMIRIEKLAAVMLFFVLFFCFSIKISANAAKDTKTIRVAYPIQENLTERGADGKYSGYTYEYLRKLAQLTGWEYEFVEVEGDLNHSLTTLLTMLEHGEIDLMGGVLEDENTLELFDFPGSSYGTAYCTLSVLEGNNTLNESNLMSGKEVRIAVLKKAKRNRKELENFCEINKIDAQILEYQTEEQQLQALRVGEADAMLGVDLSLKEGTRIIAKFGGNPYYFVTTKGNAEVLQKLNTAMLQLEATEPYFSARLYETYFKEGKAVFSISAQERNYVEKHPVLRVFISSEIAPFQYKLKGKQEGISIQIVEQFAEHAGFQVEYVERDKSLTMKEQIAEQNFDFMIGVPYDYDFAEQYDFLLSTPYVTTQTTIFSKNTLNLSNLQDKTVVLTKGMQIIDEFKNCKVVYANSLKECVEAVYSGRADFGYGNSYSIGYFLSQGVYPNMLLFPLFNQEKSYCFAFLKSTDPQILLLLNRYLDCMEDNEVYLNMMQHISNVDKNIGIMDYLRMNPSTVFWLLFLVSIVIIVVVIYFVKSQQEQKYLKAQNDAQVRFLSNMSHEMRTPLNTIIGLNDLAEENITDTSYVQGCVQKINVASNHLLQLINDILDMSKIGQGKMSLQERTFDVIAMLQSIDTIYQLNAKEKNIKLTTEIDFDIERYIKGDELRLKQVLINLLLNGIKYNKVGGEVLIQAELVCKMENINQEVCFSVIDTGYGILEENKKKIFSAFEREERSEMEGIRGTGLGLAISNEIVKMMHSELKLESKIDKGSKFSFSVLFPIANEQEKKEIMQKGRTLDETFSVTGMRFLLFEDNEINATIVKKILESKGGEVVQSENGKIGCELFETSDVGYFDLILMDIRMPIMDGYEATKYIRALERTDAATIPIFALSANAFSEDVVKSRETGMNEHLAKPLDKNKLFAMISKYRA